MFCYILRSLETSLVVVLEDLRHPGALHVCSVVPYEHFIIHHK